MYENLGNTTLKSGETVEVCMVTGPDRVWAARVIDLLGHKPGNWQKQTKIALTQEVGVDMSYYLLARDGVPFSNIVISSHEGVGLLGHVYTVEEDRRKGAASLLMDRVVKHFKQRGGKALYLGTNYDSPPYHIYSRFGFKSIEPDSGVMEWYADDKGAFDSAYYQQGPVQVQPVDWVHWPTTAPLFCGGWTGVVRCSPAGVVGRMSSESPVLNLVLANIEAREARLPATSVALVRENTARVMGIAAWSPDKVWPATNLVDVYCHPEFWPHAGKLLKALQPPRGQRQIAYADARGQGKQEALEASGFRKCGTLPLKIASDKSQSGWTDVVVYEKI